MKRWRVGLLGLVVSLAAVYFIASQVNLNQLKEAIVGARYIFVLPTAFFLVVGLVTRALRWQVLLGGDLPLGRTFSIMNVAYLVNGVLPLRIGEVARMYLATRSTPPVPPMKTASTIVVERLLDLLGVVVMVVLALLMAGGAVPDQIRATALFSGVVAVVGFGVLVVMAQQRPLAQRLLGQALGIIGQGGEKPLAKRLSAWLDHFLDGLQPLTRPRKLFVALGWTAASWGFSAIAGYILMFTFYPQASWAATLLYIAAAAFAIAVPAVPGNLGPYEGSIYLAISVMGYASPAGTAVAFAVLVHGLNLAVHAATGVLGFIQEGISLEQLSQGVQEMRQS